MLGGRKRLGLDLQARSALSRAELRLPDALIQWYLQAVHGLELSVGAIVAALHRVAAAGTAPVAQIQAAIRGSPVVYADETGLRQDGHNGYLWSFSTARERLFVHGRRIKEMVDAALSPDFTGVLVTDFYAAYDHYAGPHQRCWSHLLREVHTLREHHPADAALRTWAQTVHGVYQRACRLRGTARTPAQHLAAQRQCEADLLRIGTPFLSAAKTAVPQRCCVGGSTSTCPNCSPSSAIPPSTAPTMRPSAACAPWWSSGRLVAAPVPLRAPRPSAR